MKYLTAQHTISSERKARGVPMVALHKSLTLLFLSCFLLQFLYQARPSANPFNAVLARGHEAWCYYSIFLVVSIISTTCHHVYICVNTDEGELHVLL